MPPRQRLSQSEFIALVAMLSGTVAFSIDAMLPALPEIVEALSPGTPNRAQLIITSFMLGLGAGTFITGSLSDQFGRRPVMLGGALLYCLGALLAWAAQSLEMLLFARLLQGLGASGPRVVAMAVVRDLYSGAAMARIMSFVMMVFTLLPAIAPSLGAAIVWAFGWREIFLSFLLFSALTSLWLVLRLPETLAPEHKRKISPRAIAEAFAEMRAHPTVRLSALIQIIVLAMLLSMLSSVQQMFDTTYGKGANFPLWFGFMALLASSASMLNARLVMRLGMRRIIKATLLGQLLISGTMSLVSLAHLPLAIEFMFFFVWITSLFFTAALCMGNLNALAMEPMGHVAGRAASILSALSTIGAVLIAVPIGLAYDGTPVPMAIALAALSALALWLTAKIKRPGE